MLAVGMVFTSCSNDEVQPVVVTQENEVADGTISFTLSVHVTSNYETSSRVEGLEAASVTINQNGFISTSTVGADGIAVFTDLKEGQVSIYVKADNHCSSNVLHTLEIDTEEGDIDEVEFERVPVVLRRLGAKIAGTAWVANEDLDNDVAPNSFTAQFVLKNTNLEPNVFTATTDASGKFTFTGLPHDEIGTIKLSSYESREVGTINGETVNSVTQMTKDIDESGFIGTEINLGHVRLQ